MWAPSVFIRSHSHPAGCSTDAEFLTWIETYFLHNMTTAQAEAFTALYSSANAAGSPFNTSSLDMLSPQFKRIAAFQVSFSLCPFLH
jgi:hypothetical protein